MWDPEDGDGEPAYIPRDLDAEKVVLGAMLTAPRIIDEIADICTPQDFHLPRHIAIAEVLVAMHAEGRATDPVAVHDEFMRRGQSTRIGGGAYLHTLMQAVPTIANAGYYAEIVRRYAQQRRLADIGLRLQQMGAQPNTDLDDIPDLYAAAIKGLTDGLADTPTVVAPAAGDLLTGVLDAIEKPALMPHVPTGFRDLDRLLSGGVAPGQLILIAARPGVGKSVFALTAARSAAVHHAVPTLMFSLEMGASQIMRRLVSAEALVPLHHIQSGEVTDDDWARIGRVHNRIAEAKLHIDDNSAVGLGQIRHAIATMQRTHSLGLVIIDYLQLMAVPKAENRQQAVAEVSRGLKLLAKEFEIPIIALSQLNRNSETRADKRPQMSDLRESGALEQDADVIVLMHREDVYDRESPRAGECELLLVKNRDGVAPADVTVAFQGHYARLVDMARDADWTPHAAMPNAA
jgi:replicative DNA helicase